MSLAQLRAVNVTDFVQRKVPRLNMRSAKIITTGLRSFLSYARYRGDISGSVDARPLQGPSDDATKSTGTLEGEIAKFWDTVICRQPRSTPRSIYCEDWRCHGREKPNEHIPTGCSGVRRDAARAGVQAARDRTGIDRFRRVSVGQRHATNHDGTGPCLGSATVARAAFALGHTAGVCPRIRPSSSCH